MIGAPVARAVALSVGRAIGGQHRGAAGIIGFQQVLDWINSGVWNDLVPTSDAWSAAVGWLFNGIWDDAAPTGAATWSSPDATAYTIWADTEATV